MEEIGCIFCKTESSEVVIEENGYKGRKCPHCGLIYISPRPSYDEIAELYGHDNAYLSAESHIYDEFLKRLYARHHLRIISSVVKQGALLEIGSGAGYFLDEARKIGFSPSGLELNPIQAKFIREELNIPCEESQISTSIFGGRKFDVVYHCDVMSHLFDPISDFITINSIMNDEAYIIFETGNLGEVDQKYFKHIQPFQYPDHLFFFSSDNLKNLLDITGFKVLEIYRYSTLPESMFTQVIEGMKNLISGSGGQRRDVADAGRIRSAAGDIQQTHRGSTARTLIRNLLNYLTYLFRYRIGYIAPLKGRPQTLIVIAQKRKTG